jgi:hypothetical protein
MGAAAAALDGGGMEAADPGSPDAGASPLCSDTIPHVFVHRRKRRHRGAERTARGLSLM